MNRLRSESLTTVPELKAKLRAIADEYPDVELQEIYKEALCPNLRQSAKRQINRVEFELGLILERVPRGGRIADVGGGISIFSPAAAELGYNVMLVDDFGSRWQSEHEAALNVIRAKGVEIVKCDIIADDLPFTDNSLDAVTSFECIEHLHNSPRTMLHKLLDALKPGGLFVLSAPNCVNLRKRITVPLGSGKWSRMAHWYDEPVFRGHVREPDVEDLRYIAKDLGLVDTNILGRNWTGYISRYPWVRALVPILDVPMRAFPGLCSDIYLVGRKPS